MTEKSKSNQEALRLKANRASRLEQLRKSPGWIDFMGIVQNEYDSQTNELLDKENPEARGAIKTIINIMNSISMDIDFGNTAREKYKKQYLTNQTTNEG